MKYTVYLAGPMRGYEQFNFPAFYKLEDEIQARYGWNVENPARADEEAGFDAHIGLDISPEQCEEFFDRDSAMIKRSNGIVMMPGWNKSVGATAEYYIARWLKKDIYLYTKDGYVVKQKGV